VKQAHDEMLKFSYQVSGIPGVGVAADTRAFKDSSISKPLQQEFSGICVQPKMQWHGAATDLPGDGSTTATGLVSAQ